MSVLYFDLSPDGALITLHFSGPKRNLYRDEMKGELLQKLMHEELLHRRINPNASAVDTIPFNEIHLGPNRDALLSVLAMSGKLQFKGKRLYCDPFAEVKLSYEILPDKNELLVEGFLLTPGRREPVESAEALFPNWVIVGGFLKKLSPKIDYKWFSYVFPQPLLLEGKERLRFIDRFEEGPFHGSPEVLWNGAVEKEEVAMQPLLVLGEKSLNFCELYFLYGYKRVSLFDPTFSSRLVGEEKKEEQKLLSMGVQKMVPTYFLPTAKCLSILADLKALGWKIEDHAGKEVSLYSSYSLDVKEEGEVIVVGGTLFFEGEEVPIAKALPKLAMGKIDLPHKVALFDREQLEKELEPLLEGEKKGESVVLPREMALPLHREDLFGIQVEEALPSKEFLGSLRPYQQEGVNWLTFLSRLNFSALLADEMGLGKTVQIIAFLSRQEGKTLIVVPKTLIPNWERELKRFLPHRTVSSKRGDCSQEITITSYALLRQDRSFFETQYWNHLILDEAQTIKNQNSQIAKVVCSLKSRMRIALTGTPVENSLSDLYSLFHFLIPGLLKGKESIPYLKQKIRSFYLTRKKQEVAAELPEKVEEVVYLEMSDEERSFYEKQKEGDHLNPIQILETILRLRQACFQQSKKEQILEDLRTALAEGKKVLIYSQFVSVLDALVQEFEEEQIAYLHGGVKKREEEIEKFNSGKASLFFLSLKVGGVGLNLPDADLVFFCDPWWNLAAENQAIDRAHRLGREKTLFVRRYVMVNTIEEKVLDLQEEKGLLAEEIGKSSLNVEKLTSEELMAFLS